MAAIREEIRTERAQPTIPVLKPREVRELLKLPDMRTRLGRRNGALLSVLVLGGLRVGEACRLNVQAIETEGGRTSITVKTSKQRSGSPARWRTVYLTPMGARLVRTYIDRDAPRWFLFPGRRNEPLSTSAARRVAKAYLLKLGRSDLHCHSLRHSFGSMVVKTTRNIWVAQHLLGHSSPAVTSRYYASFDPTDAIAAADALAAAISPRKFKGAVR
jgi:integrase